LPREIVLGNGKNTICLDDRMRIRDIFFPNVGLENHLSGHEFKVGVWSDQTFEWVGENWEIVMTYLPDTLIGKYLAESRNLEIGLEVNDAIHNFYSLFLRKVAITNRSDKKRDVRIFLTHDFHIYGQDTGDTAMYEPVLGALVHYKRLRYFLINGLTDDNAGIYQFATGNKETSGWDGTWKDAEDGVLGGNLIAQGSVDSTVSFRLELEPRSTRTLYYWIASGTSLSEVKELDSKVKHLGVEQMLLETANYWSAWVNKGQANLSVLPRDIIRMFKTSLLIMRTHVDHDGAIIASCDSDVLHFNRDTYCYLWPRDGAIAAMAFDKAGFQEVSRLFFQFCNRVITEEGFFHHKYSPDGSVGSSWHALVDSQGRPQLPIQVDETALVLLALWKHFQINRDLEFIGEVYPRLVIKASEFLLSYRDEETGLPKPSFDLWEEERGVFTSSAAAICAALGAASRFAKVFYDRQRQDILGQAAQSMKQAMLTHLYDPRLGRFIKSIRADGTRDSTIDSSLSFLWSCEVFDARDEVVEGTMKAIMDRLWVRTEMGGVARYENDSYHRVTKDIPGNPWFICTLWLARWQIARARSLTELKKGSELLSWVVGRALKSGVLAEQIDPSKGTPLSASPLIWSHAEFVIAVAECLDKHRKLASSMSAGD
jgi:GH15 family glucan-1,4-alpha-glucosidase